MSDQEILRSRYSKGEIIEVIHGVASLMGARRKKAFFSSETKKISFEISFIEQQLETINEKLRVLDRTILETEETAKDPADTLLNFRAAKKTLQGEHLRFQEIEKKCKQIVNEKNLQRIASLTEEVDLVENQTLGLAEKQLNQSQSILDGLNRQQENHVERLKHLWAEYQNALNSAHQQRELARSKMSSLEERTTELTIVLGDKLAAEELELNEDLKILDEQRTQLEQSNVVLAEKLQSLQDSKKKIDKLDDPVGYMNQLRERLKEDKLSVEAKGEVFAAISGIINEVEKTNQILAETITGYRQDLEEFEKNVLSLPEERVQS